VGSDEKGLVDTILEELEGTALSLLEHTLSICSRPPRAAG
jgi:hypothetical protein